MGAFLLAGSEIYKMANVTTPVFPEIKTNNPAIPAVIKLHPVFPNPFNPQTTIKYSLYKNGYVELALFDLNGHKIKSLVNQYQNRGEFHIVLDASNLASGNYICMLKVDSFKQSRKLILLR